jgi:hypothetical protein
MTTLQLYRLSGLALVIGMVLSTVSAIVSGVVFPDSTDVAAAMNPLNILLSVVGVVGSMLALLGLPGMYARAAREGGLLWLGGVVLIAITGMIFGVFLGLMGALVFPVLASQATDLFSQGPPPAFFALFIVANLANVFGALLMAVPMITRGIYARWCGYVMLAAAVLAVVNFVTSGPGATSLVSQVLGVISPLPLYLVLGWAGYRLWSTDEAPAMEGATGAVAAPRVRLSA